MNKTLVMCRHCKTRAGEIKVTKSVRKDGSVTQYLWCNPCNSERTKSYYHKNKKRVRAIIYKSIKKHQHKQDARVKLNYAVSRGKIKKPTVCPVCKSGEKRIEAHHTDYSKPLEVEWMCTTCHSEADRKLRALDV